MAHPGDGRVAPTVGQWDRSSTPVSGLVTSVTRRTACRFAVTPANATPLQRGPTFVEVDT